MCDGLYASICTSICIRASIDFTSSHTCMFLFLEPGILTVQKKRSFCHHFVGRLSHSNKKNSFVTKITNAIRILLSYRPLIQAWAQDKSFDTLCREQKCIMTLITNAVVDKRFIDKIGDKTAILRKYDMSTKILFYQHDNVLHVFEKERIHKKNKI